MKTILLKIFLFLSGYTSITTESIDVETDEKLALKYLSDYGYLSKTIDVTTGELERYTNLLNTFLGTQKRTKWNTNARIDGS